MTEIKCRYVEEEKLVAVEFTLWDGTMRHLVLPANEQGSNYGKWVAMKVNSKDDMDLALTKSKLAIAMEALETIAKIMENNGNKQNS